MAVLRMVCVLLQVLTRKSFPEDFRANRLITHVTAQSLPVTAVCVGCYPLWWCVSVTRR